MRWARKRSAAVPPAIQKNIASVTQLEKELTGERSGLDRISDAISNFAGSIHFIIAHLIFLVAWVAVNASRVLGDRAFDPFPYTFLNLLLGIEAVLLGTFVLMSQNRQMRQAEHWSHIDLQIGLLAEQETTKTLEVLNRICRHLGIQETGKDTELEQMIQKTPVAALARELGKARQPEPDKSSGTPST